MGLMDLWGSKAEEVVQRSFANAKWASDYERKLEAERRLDILEDDWKDLLWAKIQEIYKSDRVRESVRALVSCEHNVLKRISTELATVYKWGATRELDNPAQQESAKELWTETDIDVALEMADLYLVVTRDLLIVPWVDDGRMNLELLTPDRVTVIQHPRNPTLAAGFWWERTPSQTPTDTTVTKILADDKEWRLYDAGGKLLDVRPHGCGRLPATVVHAERRRAAFWCETGFQDVVDSTLMIGVLMTMLSRLQYLQSELQVTFAGEADEIAKGQAIGGDTVWTGGQYGVLNLQADPAHYIQHINARLAWIAQCYGLAADVYDLSGTASSGYQIRLKRLPLEEARRRRIKIWRTAEQDLFRLMAMVANADHPMIKIDPMVRFNVNFNEEPLVEDPATESRILDEKVKAGRLSPVDVLMRDDPDLSREQAIEKGKRIAGERGIWAKINRDLQTVLQAPDVRAQLEHMGFKVAGDSPADLGQSLQSERPRYARAIQSAGLSLR